MNGSTANPVEPSPDGGSELLLPAQDYSSRLEIADVYEAAAAALEIGSKLRVDLSGLSRSHYGKLALLEALGSLAISRRASLDLRGCPKDVLPTLQRLGFGEDLVWRRKSLKRPQGKSAFESIGQGCAKIAGDTKTLLGFIGELASVIAYSITHPRKFEWRETLYYMDRSGADAVPIVILICGLMGFILGWMGTVYLQIYGLKFLGPMLVGLSITKELGALMVAMVCIGRAGSAYAAEIGTMRVAEELDAMEAMGLRPSRFVVLPKIVALTLVMPLLTIIGDIAGIVGGMIPSVLKGGLTFEEYYHMTLQAVQLKSFMEGFLKSFVFAFLIAAIGCFRGVEAEESAKGVGMATTSSVVSGIFLVVIADLFITMLVN